MPKDAWAKARRRDIGNRAVRSGNALYCERRKKKHRKKMNAKEREVVIVRKGTNCFIRKDGDTNWKPWKTRFVLSFPDQGTKRGNCRIFARDGYRLMVPQSMCRIGPLQETRNRKSAHPGRLATVSQTAQPAGFRCPDADSHLTRSSGASQSPSPQDNHANVG